MNNDMKRWLAAIPSAAILALLSFTLSGHAEGAEPDWDTTAKYLKTYVEEDSLGVGVGTKWSLVADKTKGTLTITHSFSSELSSLTSSRTLRLKLLDPSKLTVKEIPKPYYLEKPYTKVYRVFLSSDSESFVIVVNETRQKGRPNEIIELRWKEYTFDFATEEAAKKAMRAIQRAHVLAKKADVADPFAEKP